MNATRATSGRPKAKNQRLILLVLAIVAVLGAVLLAMSAMRRAEKAAAELSRRS